MKTRLIIGECRSRADAPLEAFMSSPTGSVRYVRSDSLSSSKRALEAAERRGYVRAVRKVREWRTDNEIRREDMPKYIASWLELARCKGRKTE